MNLKEKTNKPKTIHGDLMYDFSRHASPDTSWPGSSFTQHQVVANVYATLWHKYPVVFHTATLQSNLPYIKNVIEANIQFDRNSYGTNMIDDLRNRALQDERREEQKDSLLYAAAASRFNRRQSLSGWLNADGQLQKLVSSAGLVQQYETRLKQPQSLPSLDAGKAAAAAQLPNDSSLSNTIKELAQIRSMLHAPSVDRALSSSGDGADSASRPASPERLRQAMQFIKKYKDTLLTLEKLGKEQDSVAKRYDSARNSLKLHKDSLDKLINNGDIEKLQQQYPDTSRDRKLHRWLMGIRQLSLGRSMVNYTPLSATNVSLTGLNVEYCNHYYFALAAGKIDFRYLDFITGSSIPGQYMLLGRIGIGEKESRHLHFTFYTGGKQASYTNTGNLPAVNKLKGLTLEAKLPIDRNTYITAEIAKSTYPAYIGQASRPGKLLGLSDHENEAWSLQLFSYIPRTNTRLYGAWSRMGAYFQSFNLFNNNARTDSWQARADQYLLKNKLSLSASVKKNDFTTPYIVNAYKSQSVFYSFQASLRLRKWPSFTVGYLPFSQLTAINGQLAENRFYTLVGTTNYAYRVKSAFMNTSVVYTRYFNSGNQQGFLFYNAQSWFLNHTIILKRFTLGGMGSVMTSPGYTLYTAGPGLQWKVRPWLSAGGGLKYNDLLHTTRSLGYNGNIDCNISRWGRISASYELGYLPAQNNRLFRNNWGRIMYTKIF